MHFSSKKMHLIKFTNCVLLVCTAFGLSASLSQHDLEVNIPNYGRIVGAPQMRALTQREYPAFTAIPYGNITSRFQPAEPVNSVGGANGFFDATQPQLACSQPPIPGLEGATVEDCLTLNVYTPKIKRSSNQKLLPVIVFIHGGSFYRWSGNLYNGKRLLEKDVVLVSINYRLGVLGWFCLQNDDAPGNAGLYDQLLALQWVQNYIEYFGGDPNLVTIAGQSAGAASVQSHLASPLSNDLFHRAISHSGDILDWWATEPTPLANSLTIAGYFNCLFYKSDGQLDTVQIHDCMGNIPAEQFNTPTVAALFYPAPVIQNFPLTKYPAFLPLDPRITLASGKQSNVPLILGTTKNDASFIVSRLYAYYHSLGLDQDPDFLKNLLLPSLFSSIGMSDTLPGLYDSLATLYLRKSKDSGNFTQMIPELIDLCTVFYFKGAALTHARQQSVINPNVYLYSFDYYGEQTWYQYTGGVPQIPRGVTHADDMMYLFYYQNYSKIEDLFINTLMVNHWANFAYSGNPNPPNTGLEYWPKFSKDSPKFLKINTIPSVGDDYPGYWPGAMSTK